MKFGLIVLLIIALLGGVQYLASDRYDAQVMVVEADNSVGVNPTQDALDFGDLAREAASQRYITLENNSESKKTVRVYIFGKISDVIRVSQKKLMLKAGEEKEITFTARIPVSAPVGKLTGKVVIIKLPF